jgi:hypothetical protein
MLEHIPERLLGGESIAVVSGQSNAGTFVPDRKIQPTGKLKKNITKQIFDAPAIS